jgi:uncharacterized integral membrane protein
MESSRQTPHGRGRGARRSRAERYERTRLATAFVITALITAFAVINVDSVEVHWIVATGRSPLIVVIIISFLLGIAADRVLILRRRRAAK